MTTFLREGDCFQTTTWQTVAAILKTDEVLVGTVALYAAQIYLDRLCTGTRVLLLGRTLCACQFHRRSLGHAGAIVRNS